MQNKQAWILIISLAVIKLIIPYIGIHPDFELQRDEYLYLSYAQHMDWGYMEAPPLMAVFSWLSLQLGNSMSIVRFWPAFFGALTIIIIGKTVLQLGGKIFAVGIACMSFLVAGYLRMGILFQPNFLEVFCWTWSCYFLVLLIQTNEPKYFYWLAFSFGIGFLAKYSALFFLISVLAAAIVTPQRKWFRSRHLYYSILLALVIVAPNLWWQYQHKFPVLYHMKLLKEQQLEKQDSMEFIINQFLMTLPCFFVWIAGLWHVFFTKAGKQYQLFGWAFIGLIILLLMLHGKPYYTVGIYPVLFAVGAIRFQKIAEKLSLKWLRFALPVVMTAICIPIIPVSLPIWKPENLRAYYLKNGFDKTGILKWEERDDNALPQDFADMLGWREITEKTAKVYNALPDSARLKTFIYCRNYGQAGSINYFAKQYNLSTTAYSDDASFLFWMPEKYDVENLILVGSRMPGADDAVFQQFETVTIMDSVTNPLSRQYGNKIILFEHAKPGTNEMIANGIKEDKSKFYR